MPPIKASLLYIIMYKDKKREKRLKIKLFLVTLQQNLQEAADISAATSIKTSKLYATDTLHYWRAPINHQHNRR